MPRAKPLGGIYFEKVVKQKTIVFHIECVYPFANLIDSIRKYKELYTSFRSSLYWHRLDKTDYRLPRKHIYIFRCFGRNRMREKKQTQKVFIFNFQWIKEEHPLTWVVAECSEFNWIEWKKNNMKNKTLSHLGPISEVPNGSFIFLLFFKNISILESCTYILPRIGENSVYPILTNILINIYYT